jgi:hypothetical protein
MGGPMRRFRARIEARTHDRLSSTTTDVDGSPVLPVSPSRMELMAAAATSGVRPRPFEVVGISGISAA